MKALVWKRTDFRESSRVVTLLTRERGRVRALAKGAHRPSSALLGKIDFLNRLEVSVAGKGMPILGRTRLIHEPRALREPQRFLTAVYVVGLFDLTLLDERSDRELFDLCEGGLTLVERAPIDRLRQIVAGLELRLLGVLGQLPALSACSQCGRSLAAEPEPTFGTTSGGVFCAAHRPQRAARMPQAALGRLVELAKTPGRRWPATPPSALDRVGLGVLGRWIAQALEALPRSRAAALQALDAAERRDGRR